MRRLLSAFSLGVLVVARLAATDQIPDNSSRRPPSLRAVLSPADFHRAGLDKLTPAELGVLEELLAQGSAPVGSATAQTTKAVSTMASRAADVGAEQLSAPASPQNTELRSRIQGRVTDLNGRTVFALANGQIWQQRTPDRIPVTRPLADPEVVITRGFAGYTMQIVGLDRLVYVKRVR